MERWQQIESLFQEALQRPVGERDAWLREACASDVALHQEVASLLANHHGAASTGPWAAAAAQLVVSPGRLEPGRCLGPYQVVSFIAAGGMGEVYRARDTKLKPDVAIKVLPAALANDPERLARFDREARLLASLEHPNIGSIYGLEESNGTRALVLALIDGPTLADRIGQNALPVGEATHVALQIAAAFEYAHDRGVIHRDLKPANVKITPDGTVKVLDFGLSKAIEDEPLTAAAGENSPTRTLGATRPGIILGTAAYISPEQVKGKRADRAIAIRRNPHPRSRISDAGTPSDGLGPPHR
jgi:serine/threonine protein kinase